MTFQAEERRGATSPENRLCADALVVTAFRCAMAGFSRGDTESWRIGWQALATAVRAEAAGALYGQFYGFVRALHAAARKPLAWLPPNNVTFCSEETLALRMIRSAQAADPKGAHSAGFALLGADEFGAVLQAVQALADSLAKHGLVLDRPAAAEPRRSSVTTPPVRSARSIFQKLVAAGMRPTRQRLSVGQLIFQSGDRHFTAETLYNEARSVPHPPSRATIYNTLEQFVACGLLRELAVYDSTVWYDTTTGPHCHFYNQDTKELSDIPGPCDVRLNAAAPEGSRIDAIDIIVRLRSN